MEPPIFLILRQRLTDPFKLIPIGGFMKKIRKITHSLATQDIVLFVSFFLQKIIDCFPHKSSSFLPLSSQRKAALCNPLPPRTFIRSQVTASPWDERLGANEEQPKAYFWVLCWREVMRKTMKLITKGQAVTVLLTQGKNIRGKILKILMVLLTMTTLSCSLSMKKPALPPQPQKIEEKLVKFGDIRIDSYSWMKDRKNPQVLKHIKSENTYTEKKLRPLLPFKKDLFKEMVSRIQKEDSSVPTHIDDYYYYTKYNKKSEYPILVRKKGTLKGQEEILLDSNIWAKNQKFFHMASWKQSPDHNFLAFSIDILGRHFYTIRIKNLQTGEILNTQIENVTGKILWAEDNKTLFYSKQNPKTLRHEWVYAVNIHTGEKSLIYHEEDEKFYTGIYKSRSKKYIIISSTSFESSESWLIDAKNPYRLPRLFQKRHKNLEYNIDHAGEFFFVRSNRNAENFKIFRTPNETKTSLKYWKTYVEHRSNTLIKSFHVFKDYLVMKVRQKGLSEIEILNRETKESFIMNQPEQAYSIYIENNPNFSTQKLRYQYTSMTTPLSVIDFDFKTKEKDIKKVKKILGDFQPGNYVSERLFAPSKDGVQIPISLVYKKGTRKNGSAPLLLYGYGSYGYSLDPYFSSPRLSLLDRGFIFAIAHVRGSSTLGRRWYLNGKYLKKKNTFNDFITSAKYLISKKYTQKDRIYALGHSAGGLLIGAVINQEPQLFKGVIAGFPFVDVLNTMLDKAIPLTTYEYEEWGNPNIKKYYDYIKSYSPYDNIKEQAYPHLLVTSGFHDSQVQYWEPTKWVAKLRDFNTSSNPILLNTNLNAGHGGHFSGRFKSLKDRAQEYAFFIHLFKTTTQQQGASKM